MSIEGTAQWDLSKLPDAKELGLDLIAKIHQLQEAHWGHEDSANLDEGSIKAYLVGANRLMEFALSMEIEIINLKKEALRMYNIALGGATCGKLLRILEDVFGYDESDESKQAGREAESVGHDFSKDNVEPSTSGEPEGALKRAATPSADKPPSKKAHAEGIKGDDICSIKDAKPFTPYRKGDITNTGISKTHYSLKQIGKKSLYGCKLCPEVSVGVSKTTSEQQAQITMHIRCHHLGHCLMCRHCGHRMFRSVAFRPHMEKQHADLQEDVWYAPLPDISNVSEVIDKDIIRAINAIVKVKPTVTGAALESDD